MSHAIHSFLADLVVVAHLGFIAFAALGGLLVLRRRRMAWLHLPAVAWGAWIELSEGVCPLTPLENWLRAGAGRARYGGSFVEHYLLPVVYPPALSREAQMLLAGALVLANAAVYFLVWRRARSDRSRPA
jgi:hypothetical protein